MQGPARRKGSSLRLRGREGRRCTRRPFVGGEATGDVREPQASFGFQPVWGLRAGGQRAVRILCLVGFQHRAGMWPRRWGRNPVSWTSSCGWTVVVFSRLTAFLCVCIFPFL